jgi:hypothetical protein
MLYLSLNLTYIIEQMLDVGKKKKPQTASQEIIAELERTEISLSKRRSRTSKQTSPSSTTRISRPPSPPSFSSTTTTRTPRTSRPSSPPSISTTTIRTLRTTSPPSFSSTTARTSREASPIVVSSSPPSPTRGPYVYITPPQRPSLPQRFTMSTRSQSRIESTSRRTYGRTRGRGKGERGSSRKYKGKGKEPETRDDYGSPKEGWIDIGSGIKKSVTLESQIKYMTANNHVHIKFIFKIYIFF